MTCLKPGSWLAGIMVSTSVSPVVLWTALLEMAATRWSIPMFAVLPAHNTTTVLSSHAPIVRLKTLEVDRRRWSSPQILKKVGGALNV